MHDQHGCPPVAFYIIQLVSTLDAEPGYSYLFCEFGFDV